jgi:hypothetical protein
VIVSKAVLFVKDFFHTFDFYITNFPQICDRKTKFFEFSYYILDFFDLFHKQVAFFCPVFPKQKIVDCYQTRVRPHFRFGSESFEIEGKISFRLEAKKKPDFT